MAKYCCVPGCGNNTFTHSPKISFHKFPTDVKAKREWLKRIHRVGYNGKFPLWKPTQDHRICGVHFNKSGRKSIDDTVPIYFPNKVAIALLLGLPVGPRLSPRPKVSALPTRPTAKTKEISSCEPTYFGNELLGLQTAYDLSLGAEIYVCTTGFSDAASHSTPRPIPPQSSPRPSIASTFNLKQQHRDHDYYCTTTPESTIAELRSENDALKNEVISLKRKIGTLELELNVQKRKNEEIGAKLENLEDMQQNSKEININTILQDEEKVKFYTSFNSVELYRNFSAFIKSEYAEAQERREDQDRPQVLEYDEQLFLVLCRLRLGLLEQDIAYRFQISIGRVSDVCSSWFSFLSRFFEKVKICATQTVIQRNKPNNLLLTYPAARIILDCTEIFTDDPSDCRLQSDTSSSYKSHNSAKGLLGITPNGLVSFVSDLYPGAISDEELTARCGFEVGDGSSVMAGKGFIIEEMFRCRIAFLNVPPFLRNNAQLPLQEKKLTREIIRLRIHVQRVIAGMKRFRILKTMFSQPINDKLNSIWKICCYLHNFTGEPSLSCPEK